MREHRQVVEGVIYRYRCGIAWRDLPSSFELETAVFEGLVQRVRAGIAYRQGYLAGMREVRQTLIGRFDGQRVLPLGDGALLHVPSMAMLKSTSRWHAWPRMSVGYVRLFLRVLRGESRRGASASSRGNAGPPPGDR
jgi:hypothetical protein